MTIASRKLTRGAENFPRCWAAPGAILCCFVAAQHALAQSLRDPMQPPASVSGIAATETAALASTVRGLQLVKASRDRREATIDGKIVRVGQKVGEATLLEISDSTAVLRGPEGERITLYMFPNVDKRVVKLTASKK